MDSWTIDQVGDWLKANGFEKYTRNFTHEDIDGVALMGLQDDDILKLFSIQYEDGTTRRPTMRTQRKFRTILEEYRTLVKQERKKNRRSGSSVALSRSTVYTISDIETYSKTYTVEPTSTSSKFFKSELICSNLTKYFRKKYNVKCHIPIQDQYNTKVALHIKLSGVRENVKNVQKDLKLFFETIQTKIFNNENTDKRVIKWSTHIYSDSAVTILQKIFSDKKKFTIWEKTNILSGYYVVHYVSGQHEFSASEEFIDHTLHNEISYVKDIVISNMENMQTKFRKELDEFINEKKEQQRQFQTMAIIYCQYPSQTEMKISFFGLKNQVNIAKKQIKLLINRHRMKTIRIGLDPKQRDYLLDNCVDELKKIELDYKDDNVKIQIHANVILAPQYLIMKVKQLIQSMICETIVLIFQYIPNDLIFTEKDYLQLKSLAQNYNCEISKIDIETKKELITLPHGKNTSSSQYIIKESNQFYSSLSIPKRLFISNNTIEIHKSYDLKVDITIISTTADAHKEMIDPTHGNGYFESDTGKKMLFIQWSLPHPQEDNNQIRRFISACFKQINTLCTDAVKTIAFSTTDWEKYDNRKQLVEGILHEIKYQLETEQFSNRCWKILFIFDDEQTDFFNEFSQVICTLQTDKNDSEQFFYPVSTTSMTLKTSGGANISRCENVINNYMKNHILTTIELNHPFNPKIWNQYMINAFYKYCLEKFVLPKTTRTNKQSIQMQCLNLIGPISAVNEVKQKHELMSEIAKQRVISESDTQSSISSTQVPNNASDSYNIILSCCSDDKILSRQLAQRLIDEGYLVSIDYSDKTSSNIVSRISKTDVVIICFSFSYSENHNCMTAMMSINRSGTKVIPILFTETLLTQEDSWLQRTATEELFYESFEQEIKFKLKENLDLDYDKLILELLQSTKPGAVGRIYPISNTIPNDEEQREENLDQSDTVSQFTPEQIREKEQIYERYIEQILEKNKIPEEELTDLIESLKVVLEDGADEEQDTKESVQDSNQEEQDQQNEDEDNQQTEKDDDHQNDDEENQQNDDEEDQQNEEHETSRSEVEEEHQNENEEEEAVHGAKYLRDFLSSIRRWLEKATNGSVIKGNLPSFTVTGDFNDAVFPISSTNKIPWWVENAKLKDFDHSSPALHLRYPLLTIGSWCNYDEAHHYYQKIIDKDIQFREYKQKERSEQIESTETEKDTEEEQTNTIISRYPHFKTNIKRGTTAWDITQNREVLKEYERRENGGKSRKPSQYFSKAWECLMDKSVKLISDIKKGKIDMKSDEVQGRIGKELKSKEEMRKRNEMDDPTTNIWRSKPIPARRLEFTQAKVTNTIEWQQFCAAQANK